MAKSRFLEAMVSMGVLSVREQEALWSLARRRIEKARGDGEARLREAEKTMESPLRRLPMRAPKS